MNAKLGTLLLAAVSAVLFAAAPAQAQYPLTNQVLQLDGNGDFVNLSAASAPSFTTQLTVEAWIKTSVAAGDQAVVSRYNNSTTTPINNSDDQFQLSVHNGKGRFQVSLRNNTFLLVDGATLVADGAWHHLAGVYNGIHVALVVDGAIDAPQQAATASLYNPANTPLRIGAARVNGIDGFFFNGEIDEVRLWDAALAATTINTNRLYALRDRSGRYPIRMSWRFNGTPDTGSGTFMGNAHLATPATQVPVNRDSYIRMDGDQEYVRLQSSSNLRSDSAITIEAWVRPLAIGALQSVVSKYNHNSGTDSDDEFFLGIEANGVPRFQISIGTNYRFVNGPANLFTGHWYHLAGVFDGRNIRLYVNGVDVASDAFPSSSSIPATSTPVYIGASREGVSPVDAHFFDGYIDDVRIWNVALDPSVLADKDGHRNSCWSGPPYPQELMARYLFEGDFLNRVTLDTTQEWHGQPRGTAERMTFVGSRSYGQGSCH